MDMDMLETRTLKCKGCGIMAAALEDDLCGWCHRGTCGIGTPADVAISLIAPLGWYGDPHGPRDRPRCCEALRCLTATLAACPRWSRDDLHVVAQIIVDSLVDLYGR